MKTEENKANFLTKSTVVDLLTAFLLVYFALELAAQPTLDAVFVILPVAAFVYVAWAQFVYSSGWIKVSDKPHFFLEIVLAISLYAPFIFLDSIADNVEAVFVWQMVATACLLVRWFFLRKALFMSVTYANVILAGLVVSGSLAGLLWLEGYTQTAVYILLIGVVVAPAIARLVAVKQIMRSDPLLLKRVTRLTIWVASGTLALSWLTVASGSLIAGMTQAILALGVVVLLVKLWQRNILDSFMENEFIGEWRWLLLVGANLLGAVLVLISLPSFLSSFSVTGTAAELLFVLGVIVFLASHLLWKAAKAKRQEGRWLFRSGLFTLFIIGLLGSTLYFVESLLPTILLITAALFLLVLYFYEKNR